MPVSQDQIRQWWGQYGQDPEAVRFASNSLGIPVSQVQGALGATDADVSGWMQQHNMNPAQFYQPGMGTTPAPAGQGPGTQQPQQPPMTPGGGGIGQGYGQGSFQPMNFSAYQGNIGSDPYLQDRASDAQRRVTEMMNSGLRATKLNGVLAGGYGGSSMDNQQARVMQNAADALGGQLAGMYSGAWNADQNRALQRYGQDQGYSLGLGNLGTQSYNAETGRIGTVGGLQNQQTAMDQQFWNAERRTDLDQMRLGAGLLGQGLGTDWLPMQNANSIYGQWGNNGPTTTSGTTGGGGMGLLGGALGAGQLAANLGWWGQPQQSTQTRTGWF